VKPPEKGRITQKIDENNIKDIKEQEFLKNVYM
jgi:hypothetical protein